MSDDTRVCLLLLAVAFVFASALTAASIERSKKECKTTAITKGLPTLEIIELCK